MLRVGVDVGGTFTDIFVYDEESGETVSAKVPTTPENQAIGVMQSVETADVSLADVSFMAHGTTTGTNALIERKGAVTGLLSTEGFRDVLEIMRTDRETGYDLTWEKPRPLVRRRLRRDVRERVDKDGNRRGAARRGAGARSRSASSSTWVWSRSRCRFSTPTRTPDTSSGCESSSWRSSPRCTSRSRARSTPSTESSSERARP